MPPTESLWPRKENPRARGSSDTRDDAAAYGVGKPPRPWLKPSVGIIRPLGSRKTPAPVAQAQFNPFSRTNHKENPRARGSSATATEAASISSGKPPRPWLKPPAHAGIDLSRRQTKRGKPPRPWLKRKDGRDVFLWERKTPAPVAQAGAGWCNLSDFRENPRACGSSPLGAISSIAMCAVRSV